METTWGSTVPSIKIFIQKWLDNGTFEEGGKMYDLLLPWANGVVDEICTEIDLKSHLASSVVTFVSTDDRLGLPVDFFKWDNRFTRIYTSSGSRLIPVGLETLIENDPSRTEVSSNAQPDSVAIEGGMIYPYPLFDGYIRITNYLRAPVEMEDDDDIPDIPINSLRTDLIVAGVIGKFGFPAMEEYEQAEYWYNSGKEKTGRFQYLLDQYHRYRCAVDTVIEKQGTYY